MFLMAIYHKLLNSIDMEKLKILNLNFSFQRAAHYHINGGMLLMGVVLLAMFLANSSVGGVIYCLLLELRGASSD